MSLKKTWFSYVLWFVFAGISVLIAYSVLSEVLQAFYTMLSSYVPGYEFSVDLGTKAVTILLVALTVVLLRLICSKMKSPVIPRGLGIAGHILICLGIIAGFCVLHYQAFHYAYYLQSYSSEPFEQVMCFYELSKVGAVTGTDNVIGTLSLLEQAYICVIRTVFFFFGNKIEVMLFVQLVLQSVSLILLMVIGWTLQRGIFAWIPALLYAVTPTFFYTAEDAGITNFWTFVVILVLFIICLLEKAWKKKNITYLVMVFVQLLFAGFVFCSKMNVLLYAKEPFVSGGTTPGEIFVLNAEMLALAFLLVTYCVTFFMDKQDHHSLFVLPVIGYGFLSVWLSNYEFEVSYCMMLLTMVNLFFMISQSMRILFRARPEVVTGKKSPVKPVETQFEWEEMKEVMHSTEGIEVRKEEPAKVELTITEVPIDRKAPIENVLPMPKKHKPRVLDYAFEPTEDMMHFDVEIENDEYDY